MSTPVRINLLPHREQKRQARQRQFVSMAALLAVAALGVVGLVHFVLASQIDGQNSRNTLLKTEIVKLDEQIKEIDKLREQIAQVLARKQVVETLQANRNESVHLLDQLVRQLPDGIYLRSIRQVGTEDHADRLRAVECARVDADAQRPELAVARARRSSSRSSWSRCPARRDSAARPRRIASTNSRSTCRSSAPRRPSRSGATPAARRSRRRRAAAEAAPKPATKAAAGPRTRERMNLDDIRRLNIREVGNWPTLPKVGLLSILFVVIVALGAFFDWKDQYETLEVAQQQESELKDEYGTKKAKAINYDLYVAQLKEVEQSFGALVKQLPNRSEIDALLTDVNQAGLGRGLQFELFKPAVQERMADFYAELPINIRITGNYHDMGAFASDVAQLAAHRHAERPRDRQRQGGARDGGRGQDVPLPRRGRDREAARRTAREG